MKHSVKHFFFPNKIKFLGFYDVVATREDISIDVPITTLGLILMKLGDFFSRGTDR